MGTSAPVDFEFLLMESGETRALPFPASPFLIGSSEECQLRFPEGALEARHAEITVTGATVMISDLSGGHTFVNGLAVLGSELSPGAMLRLGRVELMLRPPRPGTPQGTPRATGPVERVEETVRRPTPFGVMALGAESAPELAAAPAPAPAPAALPPQERQLTPGTVVGGRYEITARLAAGGMGEVYKARHVELNKPMAIKVMRHQLSADPEFVARFKREAISTGSIGQINIVDISDFGRTDDGRFYFVMEFLDGATLARVLRQSGALTTDRTMHIAVQVARALTAAHSLGVVHRDLKPENIMLIQKPGQRDFVKVVDFGVAKLPNPDGTHAYTVMGMVVGTPQYMSPEQARAVVVDQRSDIYSLGLIIHEMLMGKPTFEAETAPSLMVKQVTEAPPPLVVEADGSVELAELVMAMLAKSPDERPQTMEAVLLTLEDLISARRVTYPATPVVTHPPRSSAPVTGTRGALATPAPVRTVIGPPVSQPQVTVAVPVEPAAPPEPNPKPATVKQRRLSTSEHRTHQVKAAEVAAPSTEQAIPVTASDEELHAAALPRSRAPLVALGLVALLALAGGGYLLFARTPDVVPDKPVITEVPKPVDPPVEPKVEDPKAEDPKVEPKVEPPAPTQVTVRLQSTPPGAEIFEGETRLGQAPMTLSRAAKQSAELRFTLAGHTAVSRTVSFARDETLEVALAKVPTTHDVARPPRVEHPPDPHPVDPPVQHKPKETPGLVDPYATDPTPKDKPKTDLKEGVY